MDANDDKGESMQDGGAEFCETDGKAKPVLDAGGLDLCIFIDSGTEKPRRLQRPLN